MQESWFLEQVPERSLNTMVSPQRMNSTSIVPLKDIDGLIEAEPKNVKLF
jgi:hypothetical protein